MKGSNRLLVRGGRVYDHDGDVHHPPVADILIDGRGDHRGRRRSRSRRRARGDRCIRAAGRARPHQRALSLARHLVPRTVRGAAARNVAALHPARWARTAARKRCARAPWSARSSRCDAASPPCRTCWASSPLNEEYTDVVLVGLSRHRAFAWCSRPWSADVPPIAMVRHKDSLPADVQEMLGTKALPMREQLDYLEHQLERHPADRHPALGRGAVRTAALHAEDAGRLRRARGQARSRRLHPRLRDQGSGPDRARAVRGITTAR